MGLKLAIMQPYFIPYIGYFQLIQAVDVFILYDDVNFINRGWVNRNQILVNGQKFYLTVPLKDASQNKLINEIPISTDASWQIKMLRTVELAYKKAPFFSEVFPLFEQIIAQKYSSIAELNRHSISTFCRFLNIDTQIYQSSSRYKRNFLKGQARILDMCQKEQARQYINPISGMELYDANYFAKEGIQINFIQSNPISYTQFRKPFVPSLSILDVLMFNNKRTIKKHLDNFNLV